MTTTRTAHIAPQGIGPFVRDHMEHMADFPFDDAVDRLWRMETIPPNTLRTKPRHVAACVLQTVLDGNFVHKQHLVAIANSVATGTDSLRANIVERDGEYVR